MDLPFHLSHLSIYLQPILLPSILLSTYLRIHPSTIYLPSIVSSSILPSTHPSTDPSTIYPSVHAFIYRSIYLSFHLPIYLSILPSIVSLYGLCCTIHRSSVRAVHFQGDSGRHHPFQHKLVPRWEDVRGCDVMERTHLRSIYMHACVRLYAQVQLTPRSDWRSTSSSAEMASPPLSEPSLSSLYRRRRFGNSCMSCHVIYAHFILCYDCRPSPLICLSWSIYLSIYWSGCRSSMLSSLLSIGAVLWETFELKDKFFKPSTMTTSMWFDLMGMIPTTTTMGCADVVVDWAVLTSICLLWHRCWPALILVAIIICVCVLTVCVR